MLIQWHTEDNSPIEQNNGKEELFEVPFGDVVCVYGKATPKEKRHINRLRGWLEKKIYRPVGPPYFEELIARAPAEDMQRKSIVDVFVETATWDELINAAYETQFDWQEQHVKKEKNDCLGRPERIYKDRTMPLSYHDPINNFGIVRETKLLHGYEYVISTYACCGQPTTHPGCWIHPTKVIQAYNPAEGFGDRIWEELLKNSSMNIGDFWNNSKIVTGTKWLNPYYYTQLDKYIQQMKPKVAPVVEIMFKEEYKEMNTSSGEHTIDLFRTLKNDQRMIWETFLQLIKDYNSIFCGNSRDEVEEIFKLREVGLTVWTKDKFNKITINGNSVSFASINNAKDLIDKINEIQGFLKSKEPKLENIKNILGELNSIEKSYYKLSQKYIDIQNQKNQIPYVIIKDEIDNDLTKYKVTNIDVSVGTFATSLKNALEKGKINALDKIKTNINDRNIIIRRQYNSNNQILNGIQTKLTAYEGYGKQDYDYEPIDKLLSQNGEQVLQGIIKNAAANIQDYGTISFGSKDTEIVKYKNKFAEFQSRWNTLKLEFFLYYDLKEDTKNLWTTDKVKNRYRFLKENDVQNLVDKWSNLLPNLETALKKRIQHHEGLVEAAKNAQLISDLKAKAKREVGKLYSDNDAKQLQLNVDILGTAPKPFDARVKKIQKKIVYAKLLKDKKLDKASGDIVNQIKELLQKLAEDIQNSQNDRDLAEVEQKAAAMAFDYTKLGDNFGIDLNVLTDPFGSEVYVQQIQNLLLVLNIIKKEQPKYANLLNDQRYNDKLVELGDIYNKLQNFIESEKQAQWQSIPNEVRRWLELTDRDAFIKESENALDKWKEYYDKKLSTKKVPVNLTYLIDKTSLRDKIDTKTYGLVKYIYVPSQIDLQKLQTFLGLYFAYMIGIRSAEPLDELILPTQPKNIKIISKPLSIKTTEVPPKMDQNMKGMFNKDAIEWINNSCWMDSVFFSLFGYVGIPLVKDIFETKTLYVDASVIEYYNGLTQETDPVCDESEVQKLHNTIIDDIIEIQKTPLPNQRCKLKTLREWFDTNCIPINWKPEFFGKPYYPERVMDMLKKLYKLEKFTPFDKLKGDEYVYCRDYDSKKFYWERNNYICGSIIFGSSSEGGHFLNFMYDFYNAKWFYVDATDKETNRFEYQGNINEPEKIPYVAEPTVMLKPKFVFYYQVGVLQAILYQKLPRYELGTRLKNHGAYKEDKSGGGGGGGNFTTADYNWKSLWNERKNKDVNIWRQTIVYLLQNGIVPGTHRFKSYVHSFIEPDEIVSWGHFVDKEELKKVVVNEFAKTILDGNEPNEQDMQFLTWMFPVVQDAGTNNGNSSIVNQNFETAQYNWKSLFVNGKYNVEMWSKTVVYFVENGITPGTFRFKCYVHKFIEPEQIVSLGHFVIEQDIIDTTIPGNLQTLLEISYKSGGGDAEMLALTNALSTV